MVGSSRGNTSTLAAGEVPHQKLLVLQNGERQTASCFPGYSDSRPGSAPAAALFPDGPGVFRHHTSDYSIYHHISGLRFRCLPLPGN